MYPTQAIPELENAAYAAWPAAEFAEYDGWQLRYADGFSRRGNSVYPAKPSTIDRGSKLDWCAAWYEERGLDLVVRQNPATEPGLDEFLDTAGFAREGLTHVMVSDLAAGEESHPVLSSPTPEWWSALTFLWDIQPEQVGGWRGIIERIRHPAGFVVVAERSRPIAAGLAVVVEQWAGLFEVIVAPGHRRRGVGGSVTSSLLSWGAGRGAGRAFLQVVADNHPAIGLYESLGFGFAYPYWYRRAPG